MMANLHQLIPLGWDAGFTLAILIVAVIFLFLEIKPPEIVMLAAAGGLVLFGVLTPVEALSGVTNEIIPVIGLLCIIVKSLELSGALDLVATTVLAKGKGVVKEQLSILAPVTALSAFLNNTIVVLLMAPVVRRWALKRQVAPSRYLMYISYAAILGGSLSLIGSSTNLVVQALLINESPASAFSFFEIGKVGAPLAVIAICYLLFASRFLPERKDPESEAKLSLDSVTAVFMVPEASRLAGKTVGELAENIFRGVKVLEVERGGERFYSPGSLFTLNEKDHILLATDLHRIAELHSVAGLETYLDREMRKEMQHSHFLELVIPAASLLIGKTLEELRFGKYYGAVVVSLYRNGVAMKGMIRAVRLRAGDTLIAITGEPWKLEEASGEGFFAIGAQGRLRRFLPKQALFSIATLFGMILSALLGKSLLISATVAVLFLLLTRMIALKDAIRSVIWGVLLMIAASFAIGVALQKSGLSSYFAHSILSVIGHDPIAIVAAVLFSSIVLTEFLSNNSSAIIMFPIAAGMLHESGLYSVASLKAIAATLLIGSSSGYAMPTGYQTHMIVYGLGGYRFRDFLYQGIPMDALTFILGIVLIPLIFPFGKA